MAELMQHSAKDAIAFGDGMNDKEMLQMAGKGCIMENAHQTLKDLLPNMEVIGTTRMKQFLIIYVSYTKCDPS